MFRRPAQGRKTRMAVFSQHSEEKEAFEAFRQARALKRLRFQRS